MLDKGNVSLRNCVLTQTEANSLCEGGTSHQWH